MSALRYRASALLVTLVVLSLSGATFGFEPPRKGFLVDRANALDPGERLRLEESLERSNLGANRIGVLLLPDLGGETIERVAHEALAVWGLGSGGNDDGILVVLSMQEKMARIETGSDAARVVSDAECAGILAQRLIPHLRNKQLYGGLGEAADALREIATRHTLPAIRAQDTSGRSRSSGVRFVVAIAVATLTAAILLRARWRVRRCSH